MIVTGTAMRTVEATGIIAGAVETMTGIGIGTGAVGTAGTVVAVAAVIVIVIAIAVTMVVVATTIIGHTRAVVMITTVGIAQESESVGGKRLGSGIESKIVIVGTRTLRHLRHQQSQVLHQHHCRADCLLLCRQSQNQGRHQRTRPGCLLWPQDLLQYHLQHLWVRMTGLSICPHLLHPLPQGHRPLPHDPTTPTILPHPLRGFTVPCHPGLAAAMGTTGRRSWIDPHLRISMLSLVEAVADGNRKEVNLVLLVPAVVLLAVLSLDRCTLVDTPGDGNRTFCVPVFLNDANVRLSRAKKK